MSRIVKAAIMAVFATVMVGSVAAPAHADVSVRDAKVSDLRVTAAVPSANQLERQFAAYFNPNIPNGPKFAVTYKGDTPKVQKAMSAVLASSRTYDFFSIRGRMTNIKANGNRLSATASGMVAGFPASSYPYYWVREGGVWKYDWKAICNGPQKCNGNPDFGY